MYVNESWRNDHLPRIEDLGRLRFGDVACNARNLALANGDVRIRGETLRRLTGRAGFLDDSSPTRHRRCSMVMGIPMGYGCILTGLAGSVKAFIKRPGLLTMTRTGHTG